MEIANILCIKATKSSRRGGKRKIDHSGQEDGPNTPPGGGRLKEKGIEERVRKSV